MYERLESRSLLSAVPFPSVLGTYTGSYQVSTGAGGTVTLNVYSQTKGKFMAISSQSVGPSSVVKGNVTKTGIVHFTAKPNAFRFHGRGSGTFADGVFNLTEFVTAPGTKYSATISVSKS